MRPRDRGTRRRRIVHSCESLLLQRVCSIALPDTNDAAHLARDPGLLLACDRRADDARGLAAQPTRSRYDYAVSGRELAAMRCELEDFVVGRLRQQHPRARRAFIDLDPFVDPTHGQRPFAHFNGHYDTWCYLPMLDFLSVDGEAKQQLFPARLRGGPGSIAAPPHVHERAGRAPARAAGTRRRPEQRARNSGGGATLGYTSPLLEAG